MAYGIFRGTIIEKKIQDGTAYYKVKISDGDTTSRSWAYDVRHGFQMDPSGGNAVYDEGTSVYISGIETATGIRDGVVLCAVRPRAGGTVVMPSPMQPIYDALKEGAGENDGAETLTGGDIYYRRGKGFFKFAYNGLYKMVAKLGLSIILDPLGNFMNFAAQNFQFLLANYAEVSFNMIESSKEAKFKFWINNSIDQLSPTASGVSVEVGHVDEDGGRLAFDIVDANTGEFKTRLKIDREGSVEIECKDVDLTITSDGGLTDKANVVIDADGNAVVKTTTFKLGKGTTDQSMVRGVAFSENYNDLIDIIKTVLPSPALQALVENKKIHDGISPELSTTNKLD